MTEEFNLEQFIMDYELEEDACDEHLSIYFNPDHTEGDEYDI